MLTLYYRIPGGMGGKGHRRPLLPRTNGEVLQVSLSFEVYEVQQDFNSLVKGRVTKLTSALPSVAYYVETRQCAEKMLDSGSDVAMYQVVVRLLGGQLPRPLSVRGN